MKKRKIGVVTGSRAEYGLLNWLMHEIEKDPELDLQVIVTGSHLSPEFGLTYRDIEADGFHVDEKIEMLVSSDTPTGITKSMGLAVIGFADAFQRLKPDIIVVLGDRYEIFAAAQAAMMARVPIAHIHGGELTEGMVDEAIRHALTKMAHLHFTASEQYRTRVIQLGEQPACVFNFGAPGLENIRKLQLIPCETLEQELGLKIHRPCFLITYHPVTLKSDENSKAMEELLSALERFDDATIIFTLPNADADGRGLKNMVLEYVDSHRERARFFTSLGSLKYLSALKVADVVIGNSSSGIIEAPFLGTVTVNIGDRQEGRLKAGTVIDCRERADDIANAIQKALSVEMQDSALTVTSLYGNGHTAFNIKEILKNTRLEGILAKKFHDLPGH